jgi:hypothetical protein
LFLDENDNPVKFVDKSPLRIAIQSTDLLETPRFLHHFLAVDADTVNSLSNGGDFSYSITDGDETLFRLNPQSGVLTQIRSIDQDIQQELNVSVTDGLFTDYLHVNIVFQRTAAQIAPLRFNSLVNQVVLNENR